MDNEIQKLKTNEDNLKSKASQEHDYKNAELRRSKDGKNPELKGDDGKLLKTYNVCLNTAAGTSKQVSDKQHKNANLNQLFEKPLSKGHLDICPWNHKHLHTQIVCKTKMRKRHITTSHEPISKTYTKSKLI
ncbi:hypothetical protein H5410_050139 [Solanum commersonii]|uniref:Uncharacterized protein n=1 Tax=Solanum commersonii TaxID=4109 RepID=A0A9J5WX03_SOLCO|nr:hypothetical protein H5410_050139 [Solanum commersonii]